MELIKLNTAKIGDDTIETVNARDLHVFLESKQDYSTWIKSRIDQYGFVENQDYLLHKFMEQLPSGAKTKIDHHVSIDMAKELSMVERNAKGKEARQYFIACEKQAKQPLELNNPASLRGMLLNYSERVIELEAKVEKAKPKTKFYDSFVNADGLYGLENAGRALNLRPILFIRWLKAKYLFYQGNALVPYIQYRQRGLFDVKTTIVDDKARPRCYITPKGLAFFAEIVPDGIKVKIAS